MITLSLVVWGPSSDGITNEFKGYLDVAGILVREKCPLQWPLESEKAVNLYRDRAEHQNYDHTISSVVVADDSPMGDWVKERRLIPLYMRFKPHWSWIIEWGNEEALLRAFLECASFVIHSVGADGLDHYYPVKVEHYRGCFD